MSAQSVDPRTGLAFGPVFLDSSSAECEVVLQAAANAAVPWEETPRGQRAAALRAVADRLEELAPSLVSLADRETGLGEPRLLGELHRTTFQLRAFAQVVEEGAYQGVIIDRADRRPLPVGHPDLRRMLVPLGPVAVFGASNFPFAFGVAGGDTASALASGCPVVAKVHPAHPQLSAMLGEVVAAGLAAAGAPHGTFGLVHGFESGRQLVRDTRIRAVAFTGSAAGGRALFDLAVARPDPIPFFGELGSLNPVFVTPGGACREGLAAGYIDSLSLGAGQFCTKPGLLVIPAAAGLLDPIVAAAEARRAGPFLHAGIGENFATRLQQMRAIEGVRVLYAPPEPSPEGGNGVALLALNVEDAMASVAAVQTECFGPAGLIVEYDEPSSALELANHLEGSLVGTVHGEESEQLAAGLVDVLRRRCGRVVWNGWPTGVAVTPAQHHGGPYPATTNPQHTSVGTTAIDRFVRPVAFQSLPQSLLPPDLRDSGGWSP